VYELFQALVGAVLPDNDHDASLLNSSASHAAHATTRVSNTQRDHKSGCTYPGTVRVSVFVADAQTKHLDFSRAAAQRRAL
jgi:hypothetical protein